MSHCPSQDWDRYIGELDEASEERAGMLAAHRDQMLLIIVSLLMRPDVPAPFTPDGRKRLMKIAEDILSDWHYHTEPIE